MLGLNVKSAEVRSDNDEGFDLFAIGMEQVWTINRYV